MAAGDATWNPKKNVAYRVTFPIFDADGDLVTGATGLDSEVSKDSGTFADCTNEATEIATSSGVYYLDLTATEMNADTVAIIVKTTSSGAKTTLLVMYPLETADMPVDVLAISGDSVAADNLEAASDGTGYNLGGGSIVAASVTAAVTANTTQWGGVAVTGMPMPTYTQPSGFLAATFPGGTIASTTNITAGTIATVTNAVTANTTQLAGQTVAASGAVTFPSSVASPTNITQATGIVLAATTHTGAVIPRVTLVDTCTTNTDMRGTDSAALAASWTATRAGYLDSVLLAANANQRTVQVTGSNHVAADIHELQAAVINNTHFAAGALDSNALAASAATEIATATQTSAMTESYRTAGVSPTLAQALFELLAHMGDSSISGSTKTLKKIDGTTAKTFTLDSSTAPTSITEAT